MIVGLPTTLGGEEGEQASVSRAFAAELAELLDVPVETYDERLTTRMADRSAREGARADRGFTRRRPPAGELPREGKPRLMEDRGTGSPTPRGTSPRPTAMV